MPGREGAYNNGLRVVSSFQGDLTIYISSSNFPIPFIANFNCRFTGVASTAGSMANLGGPA